METPRVMTVSQFTDRYEISRSQMYEEVAEGRLRLRKVGAKSLIAHEDAEAWLESLPKVGGKGAAHGSRNGQPRSAAANR
jgi:excisionase family DNA binding protein